VAELQPSIDYMAKDYESFRQLMLDRLSATLPGWQERHAPDLGIAIVETLAYVADYLSYYQDAVATEAYLGTARQRISVRRHVRLLDYILHEGCNARAWVHCSVSKDMQLEPRDVMFVAVGDRLRAELPLYTEEHLKALPEASYEIFQSVGCEPVELHSGLNEMQIVGKRKEGDTRAEITLTSVVAPRQGSVLILRGVKDKNPCTTQESSTAFHHAVLLTKCIPVAGKSPATRSITWHSDDAIPARMADFNDKYTALGNIILVDHGRSLGDGDPKLALQGSRAGPLLRRGLTHRVLQRTAVESATAMVTQNPREALPEIKLRIAGEDWAVKADLLESLPTDHHFCIEVDDDGRSWIRFGEAGTGELPDKAADIEARYRIGNGEGGNVPARTIRRIILRDSVKKTKVTEGTEVTEVFDVTKVTVTNPISATGGIEPESAATARMLAPGDMRVHQHRAISAEDYAEFARGVSGVANAAATILQEGARRVVRVAIDPKGWRVRNQAVKWVALKQRVLQRLEPVRRINHDVIIAAPTDAELEVHLRLTVLPSYVADTIIKQAKLELLSDDEKSFFHEANLTFGQSIHWSQIAARLHAIPGVANVERIKFARKDGFPPNASAAAPDKIEIGPYEIAVLLEGDRVISKPLETGER
jgi:hypothetical protein